MVKRTEVRAHDLDKMPPAATLRSRSPGAVSLAKDTASRDQAAERQRALQNATRDLVASAPST
eukprot:6898521-Prymnesium_polylepis.1